jgi:hypothetical protein
MIQERDSHLAIRRTLSEYCLLFNKSGFDVILVSQNMYYNYAGLAGLYRRKISILKRLRMSFFENKLVEVLLLWVPYKILSIFKKNLIVNYFFILKPR